jgi:hypothetical protein
MAKMIAGDTGLKSGDVKKAMTLREATPSVHQASLEASVKRIPLIAFGARGPEPSRGKGRGVSYRAQGGSGRSVIPSGFIATMGTGHRGVFVRAGKSRSRKGLPSPSPGLPIQEKFGPSIGLVFDKFYEQGQARAVESFQENLEHELAWAGAGKDASPLPTESNAA